jgi:hypothetical protein
MAFFLRAGPLLLAAAFIGAAVPSCYSAGAGTAPPPDTLYFPVGLAVSHDGSVLYAVNSDFDLQWNGGTLQSYNLGNVQKPPTIRDDILSMLPSGTMPSAGCPGTPPSGGLPLGETCAPPKPSDKYRLDSVIIGAFATDLQISRFAPDGQSRLYLPVRGDATLTWASVSGGDGKIDCGRGADGRCDALHHVGNDPNQQNDTRHVTMPGEPFGMAQTEDGTAIAITHQTDTKVSLLSASLGLPRDIPPVMQFVLDGLPVGGVGIAAIPHDPDAPIPSGALPGTLSARCEDVGDVPPCFRPAFLETSRAAAEIDLLRFYSDDGSSLHRPFLQREAVFPITSNAIGTDSRGIVIDPTPRIACKAQCKSLPEGDQAGCRTACAQLPARVFFASRTPPALGIGEVGGPPPTSVGTYDPDQLVLTHNVPLPAGPSNVYLAPIVDATGRLALRVFVVCFDAAQIVVYDPDAEAVENRINVGPGPFAIAFDPFLLETTSTAGLKCSDLDPSTQANLPAESDACRWTYVGERRPPGDIQGVSQPYRFAYVASFTESFVQVIDLDNSQPTAETFERVVFTLGQPTRPKGQ